MADADMFFTLLRRARQQRPLSAAHASASERVIAASYAPRESRAACHMFILGDITEIRYDMFYMFSDTH